MVNSIVAQSSWLSFLDVPSGLNLKDAREENPPGPQQKITAHKITKLHKIYQLTALSGCRFCVSGIWGLDIPPTPLLTPPMLPLVNKKMWGEGSLPDLSWCFVKRLSKYGKDIIRFGVTTALPGL